VSTLPVLLNILWLISTSALKNVSFITVSHFHPSLIESEVRSRTFRVQSLNGSPLVKAPSLLTNKRLRRKCLSVTDALADNTP
jgi:hypothetical protein